MKQYQSSHASWIFLYGPPGAGKTALGSRLASRLKLPFYELDHRIEFQTGSSIPVIFSEQGEAAFRNRECQELEEIIHQPTGVVALGGGALLEENNRRLVEANGTVLFLHANLDVLLARISSVPQQRPLLSGDLADRLNNLLASRKSHYDTFALRLDTSHLSQSKAAWEAQIKLGRFYVRGMGAGYPVVIGQDTLKLLGFWAAQANLGSPAIIAADDNITQLYGNRTLLALKDAGFTTHLARIQAGEVFKNIESVIALWQAFTDAHLERRSSVFAVGGGVTSDLVGFAASSYLRGISWCAVPTTLLAMVDASLGGKTSIDLPQGKNLVGAFHSPRLVLADPSTLSTLSEVELRSGLAEVVKSGIVGDPALFHLCAAGWPDAISRLPKAIPRSMAVKIRIIQNDPYERNRRASLNLGHTLGHAIEKVSGYVIPHGHAVSIGMIAACHIAHRLNLASTHLVDQIVSVLASLGLPIHLPSDLDRSSIILAMQVDKKRQDGTLRFVLPCKIGEVRIGVPIEDINIIHSVLDQITG